MAHENSGDIPGTVSLVRLEGQDEVLLTRLQSGMLPPDLLRNSPNMAVRANDRQFLPISPHAIGLMHPSLRLVPGLQPWNALQQRLQPPPSLMEAGAS